jgi:hypothetical protein
VSRQAAAAPCTHCIHVVQASRRICTVPVPAEGQLYVNCAAVTALQYDMKDSIKVVFTGEPPAGVVVVENDAFCQVVSACSMFAAQLRSTCCGPGVAAGRLTKSFCCMQPAVKCGVAKENNVVIVGLHGNPKEKEHWLIKLLSMLPELVGKPMFSKSPRAVAGKHGICSNCSLAGCCTGSTCCHALSTLTVVSVCMQSSRIWTLAASTSNCSSGVAGECKRAVGVHPQLMHTALCTPS